MKQKLKGTILNEHTKWDDVKKLLKDDSRYHLIKSSKAREKLFDDFIMNEILITPGQKRARLLDQGLNEQDPEIAKLDKSERKRVKKEES